MKTALITGVTGQDGAYLSQFLLDKGYRVYGAYRRTSSVNFWRIKELGIDTHPELKLVEFDLTDPGGCVSLVQRTNPDEIYNLAAQSFVGVSFEQPATTSQITTAFLGCFSVRIDISSMSRNMRKVSASKVGMA